MTPLVPAIILFAVAYILMMIFDNHRPWIAMGAAVAFIVTGLLPLGDVAASVDLNVLLMMAGTMGLVSLFFESRMPALLADLVMERVSSVQMAVVALALFAGVISAFMDNVATVLMVAPVAMEICKKLDTNPIPFIIAIAVSSNLQGAATLVGDTTAIMLGSAQGMSFTDFFWYHGKPGMFFIVELGALLSAMILFVLFRGAKGRIPKVTQRTEVTDFVPTILLVGSIVLLIVASFIPVKPDVTNGLICCGMLLIGIIHNFIRNRSLDAIVKPLRSIDLMTIGLLLGLFLMIGGIKAQGVIDAAANLLARVGGGNVFLLYTIIVWASVLISAFIDNIPYVATMIPVIASMSATLGIDPTVLYFGLLSGATLGGNCTPIGASANITGISILENVGYDVKNKDFLRIGIPFTLAAIIPAYVLIWLLFGV
ncbi:MAG: arsenic transporter [Clostridia bacterium]|nr:arsenic transporter [Clostridia bacterium]